MTKLRHNFSMVNHQHCFNAGNQIDWKFWKFILIKWNLEIDSFCSISSSSSQSKSIENRDTNTKQLSPMLDWPESTVPQNQCNNYHNYEDNGKSLANRSHYRFWYHQLMSFWVLFGSLLHRSTPVTGKQTADSSIRAILIDSIIIIVTMVVVVLHNQVQCSSLPANTAGHSLNQPLPPPISANVASNNILNAVNLRASHLSSFPNYPSHHYYPQLMHPNSILGGPLHQYYQHRQSKQQQQLARQNYIPENSSIPSPSSSSSSSSSSSAASTISISSSLSQLTAPPSNEPFSISRPKNRFDKLYLVQQSINDLMADLLSLKSLTLSHLTNVSFGSLEQLLTDKVKLPRRFHVLIATISHSNSNQTSDQHHSGSQATDMLADPLSQRSTNMDPHLDVDQPPHPNDVGQPKSMLQQISKLKPIMKKPGTGSTLVNLIGRCFEPYGCFRMSEPFLSIYRPINLIPEPPESIKIAFYLHTRLNPSIAEHLPYTSATKYLQSNYFNSNRHLKLIVHGYLESSEETWIKDMSAALLNRDDFNVICVDWMLGATPPYTQAVANTRLIGAIIAHLIRVIQDTYPDQYPASNIHIIGHSLGAHIAGYTGQLIPNLGQITGLDPAEPYFQYTDPLVRLDPKDAQFVDVIHTDGASIISGGFGMNQSCGHVDFYPNGGVNQPGCKETPIKNVLDSISRERTVFDGIRRFIGCNHLRSFLLYTEAINSDCPFMAFPCQNYEEFQSGQCTGRLNDDRDYQRQCFSGGGDWHRPTLLMAAASNGSTTGSATSTQSMLTCPIRMGLDSKADYSQNRVIMASSRQQPTAVDNKPTTGLVYFLQTGDRAPFCHFHYEVRLVLHVTPHRYYRSFRSRQFSLDNFILNGKLSLNIIGSRSRTAVEVNLKATDFVDLTTNYSAIGGGGTQWKEHLILIDDLDLGKILRIEMEWRPSTQAQRSLQLIQSRTIRRWLPQFSINLESGSMLPAVFNEWQRTLNATQLQQIMASAPSLMFSSMSNQLNEMIYPNKQTTAVPVITTTATTATSSITSGNSTNSQLDPMASQFEHHPMTGPGISSSSSQSSLTSRDTPLLPVLESLIITNLETGKPRIFCAKETEIKMLFQTRTNSKSVVLLASSSGSSFPNVANSPKRQQPLVPITTTTTTTTNESHQIVATGNQTRMPPSGVDSRSPGLSPLLPISSSPITTTTKTSTKATGSSSSVAQDAIEFCSNLDVF